MYMTIGYLDPLGYQKRLASARPCLEASDLFFGCGVNPARSLAGSSATSGASTTVMSSGLLPRHSKP